MTEEEFHRQRIMFAIDEDYTLLISSPNNPQGHQEWLSGIRVKLRGYIDKTGLYFYNGNTDFEATVDNISLMRLFYFKLAKILKLSHDTPIFGGVNIGLKGERWSGTKFLGHIRDYDDY